MDDAQGEARRRAGQVRIILLDADGVLTDGRLYYDAEGREIKVFDVQDGLGIRLGQRGGLQFGIISGRGSDALAVRARELGISELHLRVRDKLACAREILARESITEAETCFVGDDLIDVPLLRRVGLAVAPANAVAEAKAAAHWVTRREGGRGAVREVVEAVLHATDRWQAATRGLLD